MTNPNDLDGSIRAIVQDMMLEFANEMRMLADDSRPSYGDSDPKLRNLRVAIYNDIAARIDRAFGVDSSHRCDERKRY